MKKKIFRVIFAILLILFIGSIGGILFILKQYKDNDRLYAQAAEDFTKTGNDTGETAPIEVDFDALKQVNEDVIGWIYCEGTVIDYPVLQGEDNDLYLHHAYDGAYSVSGSIFVDSGNREGFVDSNTIIYGHHMKNGSMFASLSKWSEQQYYEEHPVMWLLTPERDYKIELFSGYTTSAYAETYTMFPEPSAEVDAYLKRAAEQSDFQPLEGIELDGEAHYVLLSTCAYVFDNARSVLHGKLVPVDSAGGVPLSAESAEDAGSAEDAEGTEDAGSADDAENIEE